MIIVSLILCFAICFIAGMHYSAWDEYGERKNLYWCIAMSLLGIYNLISLVGHVARVYQG